MAMPGEGLTWWYGGYDGTELGAQQWAAAGLPGAMVGGSLLRNGSYYTIKAEDITSGRPWTPEVVPFVPPPGAPNGGWPTGLPPASGPGAANINPLQNPWANLQIPDWMKPITDAGCDKLPTQMLRDACKGLTSTGSTGTTAGPCPKGYHATGDPRQPCAQDGISTYIPGDIGKPDYVYNPVLGRFGQGSTPVRVQTTKLGCPPGMVLGKDNVCYDHLARTHRKWNPGHKPLLTGGDMNAIRKTKSLEKRWRKVAPAFHKKVVSSGAKLVKARRK